jgi:hypothetical protein
MQAEIFMLRLEARQGVFPETLPSSSAQFVPFDKSSSFAFKDQKNSFVEPAPNAGKDFWWNAAPYIDPGEA